MLNANTQSAFTYNHIKSESQKVANNRVLMIYRENPDFFDYPKYNLFISNMIQWLSPTAFRLSAGKKVMEHLCDKKYADIISAFEQNIAEESGDGDPNKAHAKLFVDSSSTFSQVHYGANLESIKPLSSTLNLHKKSIELFSGNVFTMLGAAIAQETHALPQLENMYTGLCKYRGEFSDSQWERVSYFYDVHLDGTELRHAEDLNKTIWELLNEPYKRQLFESGCREFIENLNLFWSGIELNVLH